MAKFRVLNRIRRRENPNDPKSPIATHEKGDIIKINDPIEISDLARVRAISRVSESEGFEARQFGKPAPPTDLYFPDGTSIEEEGDRGFTNASSDPGEIDRDLVENPLGSDERQFKIERDRGADTTPEKVVVSMSESDSAKPERDSGSEETETESDGSEQKPRRRGARRKKA
jgi:hypothetical protein